MPDDLLQMLGMYGDKAFDGLADLICNGDTEADVQAGQSELQPDDGADVGGDLAVP